MLYLVGGPSRAGKSTLANHMLRQHAVPWFSLDYLTSIFHHAMPEFRISHDLDGETRAPLLWPKICKTLEVVSVAEPRYLIEGDCLVPDHVMELIDNPALNVCACWLGYADADPEAMFETLRRVPSESNDWIKHFDDDYVHALIRHGIERSLRLRERCEAGGLTYFDTARDFPAAIVRATRYLTGDDA